jgi:outer membrane usher protein
MRGDRAVPFGSLVTERGSGVSSMVGEEGQIFLSGLPLRGELLVQWGERDHERCFAPYTLSEASLQHPITLASAHCVSKG